MSDAIAPKILIVDDFESVRYFMRMGLSRLGLMDIEDAPNGKEALRLLQERSRTLAPFDLVFCDWNMPEMTGIEVLKAVRSDPRLHQTLFVLVTAESDSQSVMSGLQGGATDYIVKPFTADTLKVKLEMLMKRMKKTG